MTLPHEVGRLSAEVAWIVAVAHQRRSHATEAAGEVVEGLRQHGVGVFTSQVHLKNEASIRSSYVKPLLVHYLDEFTFRFNRRKSKHRGMLFYRLIEGAVATEPHPYKRVKAA